MRKIISYCLYGSNPQYCLGMLINAWQIAHGHYGDWECIVGVDSSVPAAVVEELKKQGAEIIDRSGLGLEGTSRMLWRWLPLIDGECTVLASRDADSCLYPCDYATVESWLGTGVLSMTIRQSQSHGSSRTGPQYLGGLCAFRWVPQWRAMRKSLLDYGKRHIDPAGCGVDQAWLSYCVYPLFRDSYIEYGHGCEGPCQGKIIGDPGPVHMGAPGLYEDCPELDRWRTLCEYCA